MPPALFEIWLPANSGNTNQLSFYKAYAQVTTGIDDAVTWQGRPATENFDGTSFPAEGQFIEVAAKVISDDNNVANVVQIGQPSYTTGPGFGWFSSGDEFTVPAGTQPFRYTLLLENVVVRQYPDDAINRLQFAGVITRVLFTQVESHF